MFSFEELSAVSDCGWPDMFNSGVFVYKPSTETYNKLIELAKTEGSFDGEFDFFCSKLLKSLNKTDKI